MPARPKVPKPPPPPKPWRRDAGAYRSDDDRFTIENGGGRWFLTDAASLDELGLARTLGPYDTLDEAKAAAVERRGGGSDTSPLADRLAAAKDRPASPRRPAASSARASGPAPAASQEPGPDPAPEPDPEPDREPAPPRTWLDDLEEEDRPAATRARRTIAALERLGIADADAVVRRDVLGRQPAVASTLLARSIAAALADRLAPGALARDARGAIPGPMRELSGVDDAALAAYAAFVAARVLDATLEVVSGEERADGAGKAQGRRSPGGGSWSARPTAGSRAASS